MPASGRFKVDKQLNIGRKPVFNFLRPLLKSQKVKNRNS